MKSLARLSLLLLAGACLVAAQEPPPGDGPRGPSQMAAGEVRYDAVGYAGLDDLAGVTATSAALPVGSHAEVTALDSGRTIVVAIVGGTPAGGRVAMLSAGAATALGMTGDAFAIRVRRVVPTPQDIVQLRQGQAASFRAAAPSALLVALRRKLGPRPAAMTTRALVRPSTAPVAKPPVAKPPVAKAGYYVQVAALSSAERAAVVARAVGGAILDGPPLWRVRLGPYPDGATAARAAADAAQMGYPGAQIAHVP